MMWPTFKTSNEQRPFQVIYFGYICDLLGTDKYMCIFTACNANHFQSYFWACI